MCVERERILRCACKCNCPTCNPGNSFLTKMIKAGVKLITAKESLDMATEKNEQYAIERFAHVMERIKSRAEYGSTSISYGKRLNPDMVDSLTEMGYTVGELEDGKSIGGISIRYRIISWEA